MRWQKTARLAIAVFVIAFGAIVFLALRRPTPPKAPERTPREDAGTVVETRGTPDKPVPFVRYGPDGKVHIRIAFQKQRTYPDGRNLFFNSTVTLPERNGRTLTISGDEMELMIPQNEARPLDTVTMSKNVKLRASDGLEVTSNSATYDETTGIVKVPGDVQFRKGRMSGSGVGATYDRERDVLWLLDRAKMQMAADEQGQGAAEATAGSAGLARAEHYVELTNKAHIVGDGRDLSADEMTLHLSEDDRYIQRMELRGNSRITGGPGTGGAEGMEAQDIDLTYAPDGRTLQHAKLVEKAVVRLAGGDGKGARQVSGRTIDIAMGPDGSTVVGLKAAENVQVDIPAEGGLPARRITAPALSAGGSSGLQTATFSGGVVYREVREGGRAAAAGERTGRSQTLIVETQPGLGAIQKADFTADVRIEDGATTAEGQRAIYHVADDQFDLIPAAGVPGPTPSVNDGRVLVNAGRITFTIGSRKLSAETSVRSSLQPSKGDAGGKSKAHAGAKASDNAGARRLPSMLKPGEVVYVTSNRLEYDGEAAKATYTGEARLWQDKTTVKGDSILVEEQTGNLTVIGHVQTVMFFEELDSATKTKQLVQMDAAGDRMVYDDAKRVATYTSGPTAKAHVVGTQGDVVADRIQLYLKPSVNELERADADGSVVVKEGMRTATGNHLTYTTADDTYVMDGTPVQVEERTPTDCRITEGSTVTFQRSAVSTTIRNIGPVPNTFKQCAPK